MNQHTTLIPEIWASKSIAFRLANIGSEIERTISWKNKSNPDYSQKAFNRALELIALTLLGPLTCSQYKEITRIRELLMDWYTGTNQWHTTDMLWQKYFGAFTMLARQGPLS